MDQTMMNKWSVLTFRRRSRSGSTRWRSLTQTHTANAAAASARRPTEKVIDMRRRDWLIIMSTATVGGTTTTHGGTRHSSGALWGGQWDGTATSRERRRTMMLCYTTNTHTKPICKIIKLLWCNQNSKIKLPQAEYRINAYASGRVVTKHLSQQQ